MSLQGKTLFISGASRGIGLSIATRAAREGANVAILAKTTEPHPKLPGTIFTAAAAVEAAGGKALPLSVDIRDDAAVEAAAAKCAETFGGIDIVINNASAISLTNTRMTPMKRYDLMNGVNARGTFCVTKACLPHLTESAKRGRNPHVLMLSPPLNMKAKWFQHHVAYSIAKYGMSLCVLGFAEEFRADGIAVNALWPRTAIDTAALAMIPGLDPAHCRTPEILADAAAFIFAQDARAYTGQFLVDEDVLSAAGVTDLDRYAVVPGTKTFMPDFFLD
jgi:citronellol/citronellal dehydrogenase